MPYVRCYPVLAALLAPLAAQWTAAPTAELQAALDERIARDGGVGLAMVVVENGTPRFLFAGRSARGVEQPIDADSLFEIGSISKVLTTTLLAEMVERGEVALDDPAQKLLPEGVRIPSRNDKPITLLDLATASSGLPRLPAMEPEDPANPYADFDSRQLFTFLAQHELRREPGAAYEYSNLGMGLLGYVLARRLGLSYEQAVQQRVLLPLGMNDTVIALDDARRARLLPGHGRDLERASNWDFDALAGAGAWRSTPRDLGRWLQACLQPPDGKLGKAMQATFAPRRPTGQARLQIGLGWHVLARPERQLVWHNGETGGYHAFCGFDRGLGANVAVLSNCAADIDDLGMHVLDPGMPLRRLPEPRATVAVAADVLATYVGSYELSPQFSIVITAVGDQLYAQATDQPRFRLFAASATRFFYKIVAAELEFTTAADGKVDGLVLHQNGNATPGRRLP